MAERKGPGTVGYAVQTPLWLGGGMFFLLTNGPDSGWFWLGFAWVGLGLMLAVSWIRDARRTRVHRATSSETEDAPE
ncbi:hypothetical protein ACFQZ2_01585 [Streptomonospora algeriensis]|uniref:Uncharacterized protein n=1 Tax=Streptomonospora algeriensis TaxID=995084 RepID=A0ABW3BC69_9ACTN